MASRGQIQVGRQGDKPGVGSRSRKKKAWTGGPLKKMLSNLRICPLS